MAVTVTTDLTQINAADATAGWSISGVMSQPAADPDSNVQGTACIEARINTGGGNGVAMNATTTNYAAQDGKHLYIWMRQSMIWATVANNGVKFRIGTAATANYGEWQVLGQDKGIASYKAWVNGCQDPLHPFQAVNGTPPALTSVPNTGVSINWLTGNGKSLAFIDQVKLASKVFVKGGGISTQGTFAEIAVVDETNGWGFVKSIGGVYFVNSGIEWGDDTTLTTYFKDALQTVIFEDFSVSGALYLMNFIGNATGTNSCVFGNATGTGVNKEGSAGVIFRAAGVVPFRVHAMNANVDEVHFFGCSFIGPAALYACPVRNFKFEDNSLASFTDDTRDANDADANDAPMMPATQALNDATYFGHDAHFYGLDINIGTAKGGTWTLTWEYWNGSAWVSLTNVTDGTNGFATTGAQVIDWTMPVDWAKTTVDGANRYWARARISSFTSSGTVPLLTQVKAELTGDVHAHIANFECIGSTFVNMGSIHVKNGAQLKKCTISDSTVPAKNGAVDFEDTNPALNTVRDLQIQNCAVGILMRGTSTGTTSYDLRNIQFANNTFDVRVDFPAGATININVLEGGDTPSVQNVNGSTVNINNSVTLNVTVVDETDALLEDVFVSIRNASTNALIAEGRTTASGLFSSAYSFVTDTAVRVLVRRSSPGYTRYVPQTLSGTITAGGLNVTAVLLVDSNVALTPVSNFRIVRTGFVSNDVSGTTISGVVRLPESSTGKRKIVAMFGFTGGASQTVSGTPTFGGNNMTLFASEITQVDNRCWGYYYDVPDNLSGAQTITATFSGAVPERFLGFAIYNKAATGAPSQSASNDGDAVTGDPTFTLTNVVPTLETALLVSDNLTVPTEAGTGNDVRLHRSDESVSGAWRGSILQNNQVTTALHTIIADLPAVSKSWVGVAAAISEG